MASASRSTTDAKTKVALNLDTYERENPAEPFVFVLGGRPMQAKDPNEVDWRELAGIDDPDEFADTVLDEDDAEFFKEFKPFPAGKLNALTSAYREHFGLGHPGN